MLNYIWFGMLVVGIIVAILNGRIEVVTEAAISSAAEAVKLCIGLLGVMCLWTGLMKIAEKSGLVGRISRFLSPVMKFLFPELGGRHTAMGAIVMNLVANFLGLGNAATPLGIKAMNELQKLNNKSTVATNSMCMFLVLNTSAVQLIPATVIAVRAASGSEFPAEIIGTVWVASSCAMITGIIAAKAFAILSIKS